MAAFVLVGEMRFACARDHYLFDNTGSRGSGGALVLWLRQISSLTRAAARGLPGVVQTGVRRLGLWISLLHDQI
jgi:hypothetical protein